MAEKGVKNVGFDLEKANAEHAQGTQNEYSFIRVRLRCLPPPNQNLNLYHFLNLFFENKTSATIVDCMHPMSCLQIHSTSA